MITIDPRFTDQFKACIQVGLGLVNKIWPITQNIYFKPCTGHSRNGWCKFPRESQKDTYVIGINTMLIHDNDIVTTVVHEVLHSFADSKRDGHKGHWRERVEIMKQTYPQLSGLARCNSYDRDEKQWKYLVKCTKCGQEWKYVKEPSWIDRIRYYRCGKCHTKTLRWSYINLNNK